MKIRILTIGQKMPAWVLTGFEDYFKRIQPFVQTQVIELPMAKRGKNDSDADILKYCQIEGESILAALKPNEVLIALEVGGRELSTEKLDHQLPKRCHDLLTSISPCIKIWDLFDLLYFKYLRSSMFLAFKYDLSMLI